MAYNLRSRAFQARLLNENSNENFGGETSDDEEDNVSEMSEESDFEVSDDDEMEVENASLSSRVLESRARGRPRLVLRGKDGFTWHMTAPQRRSDRLNEPQHAFIPGPKGEALLCNEVWEYWELLFNQQMIEIIVEHTNSKIEEASLSIIANGQDLQTYHNHTDVTEIKALLGIFYYAGLWKASNVDTDELWSKENGITFYRSVMSRARYMFLTVCLRFDAKITRNREDRLAPIREIWEIFIQNCQQYYQPHNNCTVDEQLLGFRGRCVFRMYIKSKPDKYGLKIVTLNDARTSYLINGIPYLGKTQTQRNEPISEHFFRAVTAPIHGTHRSVTCDNWFTSVPLMEHMLEPPFLLKITGTIRKNKRQIPVEMKTADRDPPGTKFCFTKNILLLTHTPKKNKVVLLASSDLRTTEIVEGKPEVILHYNRTKGGTDCFDKLCHSYTTARATRRWPLRFFFGMLDQAIVNARILHQCRCINTGKEMEALTAKQCLRKLSQHLAKPHLEKRYQHPTLRVDIKKGIMAILGNQHPPAAAHQVRLQKQARCKVCPAVSDKKTKRQCSSCLRPMCDIHRMDVCIECGGEY